MKYLKVYLFVLLILIGVVVSGTNEVDAFTSSFDYSGLSPKFQYLRDDNEDLIHFEFEMFEVFDTPALAEDSNYYISIDQVTYDGSFIKQLNYYFPEFELISSDVETFTYVHLARSLLANEEVIVMNDIELISINGIKIGGVHLLSDQWSYEYSSEYNSYVVTIFENNCVFADIITIYYDVENETDYVSVLNYDWSGIQWDDNNIIFYQVRYDELVIWTGAVMLPPQDTYLDYDVYGLEVGEFLVYGDGTVDENIVGFTDQSQFTSYADDRYIILHYRIPSTLVYPNFMSIRVTDVINNTLIDVFTTDDILSLQGGNSEDFLNSFIVLPIDNIVSEGLKIDYPVLYNDRYELLLDEDYIEGSYYFAIDDGGVLLDGASVIWNIVADDKDPFELYIAHHDLNLNTRQRATFYKHSSTIYDGYTTVYARDYDVDVSYINVVNATSLTYSVEYYPDEDLVEGDTSYFEWRVNPLFIPYSLSVNDFTISMRESYVYGEERGVEGDIESLRTAFGMTDTTGGIIFSIFILAIVNGSLMFVTRASFIFAVSNVSVIGVLSFFSLIPMWFVVAVVLIAFIGIKLSSGGGGSYE